MESRNNFISWSTKLLEGYTNDVNLFFVECCCKPGLKRLVTRVNHVINNQPIKMKHQILTKKKTKRKYARRNKKRWWKKLSTLATQFESNRHQWQSDRVRQINYRFLRYVQHFRRKKLPLFHFNLVDVDQL